MHKTFFVRSPLIGLVLLSVLCTGCEPRSSGRVQAPGVSGDVAESLMKEFDKDADGVISSAELPKGFIFSSLDDDGDKKIGKADLEAVVSTWQGMKVGMSSFSLKFKFNGKPLEGATVTLEPYPFLGSEILSASGVSDADGVVNFSVSPEDATVPGLEVMHSGFFRMKVSKKKGEQELIPAKYNSSTTLGCAVLPNLRSDLEIVEL